MLFITVIELATGKVLHSYHQKHPNQNLKQLADKLADQYKQIGNIRIEFRIFKDVPSWYKAQSYYFTNTTD